MAKKEANVHGYIIQKLIDQKTEHLHLLVSTLTVENENLKNENIRLTKFIDDLYFNLSDYIVIDEATETLE